MTIRFDRSGGARIGRPLVPAHERALLVAARPMVRQIQTTAAGIKTPADARAFGAAIRRAWPDSRIRAMVREVGERIEAAGSRPWRVLDQAAARKRGDAIRTDARREYDRDKLLDQWVTEATKLITSVRDEAIEGVRQDVIKAAKSGKSPSDLVAAWTARGIPLKWGTLEGRVKVIAQHQITQLQARVQSERARAVGASEFGWRTQLDDQVREAHRALEGTIHRYDDPPAEGLPGQPVGCRCWAETVISPELLEQLGIGPLIRRRIERT